MCYDDSARPPLPERAIGKAHGEDIILTAADGNHFAAYFARPEEPAKGQVIIYPDVRGLHQFYKELALRFAEIGLPALALDYFGRTAHELRNELVEELIAEREGESSSERESMPRREKKSRGG
jgi:carboxymethylenebutenolidase